MIKLTNLINELGINNPNKTPKEVYDLWGNCLKANLSASIFIEIFKQYGYIVGDWVIDWLNSLHPSILNKIYYEIQSKSGLNELNVNKPQRVWDLNKYNPNFDPNQIKIGDKIIVGSFTNIVINTLNSTLYLDGNVFVSFGNLLGLNNRNRKLNELNVNNSRVTPKIVYDFIKNIRKGDKFDDYWNKAEPIYNKYGRNNSNSILSTFIANLNTRDLSLLYSDLKKVFPDNINESEQITAQSMLDYWDTKMKSRPKVDWNKFNQIKTKYFGKDKYVGLMDLEDNLDNHPLQPEQLTNLYNDLQQLFPETKIVTGSTLDELEIGNKQLKLIPGKKYLINFKYNGVNGYFETEEVWVFEKEDKFDNVHFLHPDGDKRGMSIGKENLFKNHQIKPYNDKLNELGINKHNTISVQDILDLYYYYGVTENDMDRAKQIFRKFGWNSYDYIFVDFWLKTLKQSELNKIYIELKNIRKYE